MGFLSPAPRAVRGRARPGRRPWAAGRFLAFLVAAALAHGCIQTDMIRYLALPPKAPEAVEVLPSPPQRPHQLVAQLILGAGESTPYQELIAGARITVAEVGADAIFVQQVGSRYAGSIVSPGSAAATGTVTTSHSGSITSTFVTTTTPGYAAPIFRKRVVVLAVTYSTATFPSPLLPPP